LDIRVSITVFGKVGGRKYVNEEGEGEGGQK
jgi:hypothetical protein